MVDWISDNGETPHIVIDATIAGVRVPAQHGGEARVVLNISNTATQGLMLGDDSLEFSARFGGVPFPVCVPMRAVLGVYARESGEGMLFTDAEGEPPPGNDEPRGKADGKETPKGPPKLSIVK